jgi:SAM-dependent methyltransferase
MEATLQGQLTKPAAEIYEEFFVPALFGQWAERVADLAELEPGQRVLDVACGTGALARVAAGRVAPGGTVVGLDSNPGMLEVARRKAAQVDWREAPAEALPFEDASFDTVLSQFGLMFFTDRRAALQEMWRVLLPGGTLAVAVCGAIEESPGYVDLVALLERLFGPQVADEMRAPFVLGDSEQLKALATGAGIPAPQLHSLTGTARFPSIKAWMHTDVKGWTLGDMIDDAQYEQLVREAETALAGYVAADGSVQFAFPAHVVMARKS